MKKTISIFLLAITVLIGTVATEAKPTSKKKTSRTTQTTKKKSTTVGTPKLSVEGKTYKWRGSNGYTSGGAEFKFKKNGKGSLYMYTIVSGVASGDTADFTWKQNGDKVTITDPDGNKSDYTVVDEGKTIITPGGAKATLVE